MTLRFDLGEPYVRPLSTAAKVGLWIGLGVFMLGLAVLDAWWSR